MKSDPFSGRYTQPKCTVQKQTTINDANIFKKCIEKGMTLSEIRTFLSNTVCARVQIFTQIPCIFLKTEIKPFTATKKATPFFIYK